MDIVFFGKATRGTSCLRAMVAAGLRPVLVVSQEGSKLQESVSEAADGLGLKQIQPEDPNDPNVVEQLKALNPSVFVLAGYGKILKKNLINVPSMMCLNLHAGSLPQYRGSSPLNWALINGESSFGLSVLKVSAGVDSGELLLERSFEISQNATIADLHETANQEFPGMLLEALTQIENKTHSLTPQNTAQASYYPLRFPDDGLILWDTLTAEEIHNRIRALTTPYPGAFTFLGKEKVTLLASEFSDLPYHGEPGRVYRSTNKGLLVCAADRCLWITKYSPEVDIKRYEQFRTLRLMALSYGEL